ncbi:oligosaccharide flippase family protein [Streptomyces sp. NPDC006393]|uniref:oligosaccharide flippase family protein n=1 Tax=Streptomyces sp. NPDC006393 TaxID=3156763 RepID=UPI00340126EE
MSASGTALPLTGGHAARGDVTADVAATARGGWWGFLGALAGAVFAYAFVALVTRALGAHGAGAVFTGVAVFTILSNVCKLGADTGLVRFVSRDVATGGGRQARGLLRTALVPGAVTSTAAAALLLLSPSVDTSLLPSLAPHDAVTLVRLYAVFLPVATISFILLAASQGYGTVRPFIEVEQIGKPVLRVLLAVTVLFATPSVLSLAAAWLLPSLAGLFAAWRALRRCRARHRCPPEDEVAVVARHFWAFAAPRAVSSVFDISAVWVGVILLSALATTEEAGIYAAITRVIVAGLLLQLAIRRAVSPRISRLLALGEVRQARDLHRISTRWIALFSWPMYVVLASFPGTVLSLFGPDFVRGAGALVVLCVASAINIGVGNAQTVLLMAGKSSWHLAVTGAAFAVQVIVGVLAVPPLGVLGAALSWGAAIVVENLVAAALVRRNPGFTTIDRGYLAATGAGLCLTASLALPARLLAGDTPLGLTVGIVLAACLLGASVWRFRAPLGVLELVGVLRRRAP